MVNRRNETGLAGGVWVFALTPVVLLLALSGRYGFHRDELYFIVAGRNLDWGYIDQPPFTPLVARLSEALFGVSPTALRVLPALAVGLVAVLAGLMARRFGGGRTAQTFAAFTAAFTGVLLGEGHLLSTAVFDYAFWGLTLWILVLILDGADPKLWLGLGLVVGVGMQNKYTIVFLAAAILMSLLLTRQRRLLVSGWPWIGALVSLLVSAPNLLWQASNGWPQLDMAEALRARSDGPIAFVILQVALLSVTLAIPAFVGLWWLARAEKARPWRPIPIVFGILFVAFLATGGKAYYLAPIYSALLAAGALWFERLSDRGRRWMSLVASAGVAFGLLIALPILPVRSSGALDVTGELGETVGWPELIDQIHLAYDMIPNDSKDQAVIVTGSYGEAGAVDVLGLDSGLPRVVSGHNNYWLWGPPDSHGAIVAVGFLGPLLEPICPDIELVSVLGNPYDVENEVVGQPLMLCLEPVGQLKDVWDQARHFN